MIDPRSPNYESTPVSSFRARFHYAPSPLHRREQPVTPAVCIVTPFFNTGAVFHETAACLLGCHGLPESVRHLCHGAPFLSASGQSLQNFEWIIVNDASTDPDAGRVLNHYRTLGRHDPRIRIVDHERNHGLPAARNTGWRAARAPLIFFLDSDDLIEPTTLEKSALHLHCNPEFAFVKGYSVGFGAQEYLWSHGFHARAGMLDQNLVTATTMVRRAVLHALGGFDESIRRGMEDWEFWLRAAAHGHWGETIPEYLDWYRRRDNQHAAWDNIAREDKRSAFLSHIRSAHGHIFEGAFPQPTRGWQMPFMHPSEPLSAPHTAAPSNGPASAPIPEAFLNPLVKRSQRLLMILPWLRMGGADRFNLDLVRYLTSHSGGGRGPWEVTIATTLSGHPWLPEFTALTPDVFPLDHLGRPPQFPRLLNHLITSRRPDVVMVSNAQLGYFLVPYLRAHHPECAFVDFNHMEEPHWQNGGHPRTGSGFQDQLDLSIVVSSHLKHWMCAPPRSADPARIEVCHINADSTTFRPDPAGRAEWRADLEIDDKTPVILYAARLCDQKQPMVFARTMELLAGSMSSPAGFVALIAGDGEHYAALENFIRDRKLYPAVRMLGSIPAVRMPSLMAASDIFFLPSQWEGIALSIYEAMAAGLCVVGADVGGQAELVTPETGLLLRFPVRNQETESVSYARTLAHLIDQPERIATLGGAARRRIREHFELDSMGARMVSCLENARMLHRERPRQTITEPFARELALQGIEMLRIQELAEELWPFRGKYFDLLAAVESARANEQIATRRAAAETLDRLERSVPWRAIQRAKSSAPYKLLARARFGPDWQLVDPKEPPEVRLARIRTSRAYRMAALLTRQTRK